MAKNQNLQNPKLMKMKTISMNKNNPKTKTMKNSLKTMALNKAQRMAPTPIKTIVTRNLHHNHWRPKTTPLSKWVFENEEAPKWIISWTRKKKKRKIPSGKIRVKTISETSKMNNKTMTTSKAVLAEISLTVILGKPNLNTKRNKKKATSPKLTKTNSEKRKNNKNSWEKYKLPPLKKHLQKLIPRPKNLRVKKSQFPRSQIVTFIKYALRNNFWERPLKLST